jgi:hypothetical protein
MCKYISNIFGSYYQGHTAGSQWWSQFAMFSATIWPISFFSQHSLRAGVAGHLLICSSTATLHILSSATLNRHIKGSQTSDLVGFPLKAIWMISKNLGMLPPTVGYRHAKVWYLGGW